MNKPSRRIGGLSALALCAAAAAQPPVTWTLAADHPASSGTRSLRGIALASDEASIYGSFIQGSTGAGVRAYTLGGFPPVATAFDFFNVTTQPFPSSSSHQAEAVATDDRGWVYIASIKDSTSADNARIYICDSALTVASMIALEDVDVPGSFTGETIGGIDVVNDAGTYLLYVTRFRAGSAPYVERHVIGGASPAAATLTLDTSFAGTGRFTVPGGESLRGIDVDADGTIFIASREHSRVWRIPAGLLGVTSIIVDQAMDLATYDGRVFVTRYAGAASEVVELDAATLSPSGRTFTASATFTPGASTGYSGIDIDSAGRLFVCDQIYASNSDRILVSSPICRLDLYETIGAGCLGTSGAVPNIELAPASLPQIGTSMNVAVTGMPLGGGNYWMVTGFSTELAIGFIPLPIDLAVIGAPGCLLRVDLQVVIASTQLAGSAIYTMTIPNNPTLVGRTFAQQVLVADVGANPFGLTVSNAKRACIIE